MSYPSQPPSSQRSKDQSGGKDPWDNGHRRRNRWITRILIVVVFVASISAVAYVVDKGVSWVQDNATTTTTEAAENPTIRVVISSGMTATQVGRVLEEEGVIESSSAFVDLVKSRGSEGKLRPGTYRFASDLELIEVVDALERGEGSSSFKLTIPEGLAISQTAELLDKEGTIDGNEYADLADKPSEFVVPAVGGEAPDVTTLEGLLFPDTYFLLIGDGATELIGVQLAAFETKTASLPWDKAEALGLTPYEIVIVASLIEKEASIAKERPLISAVIRNRLKESMTLGIDATVRYAVDKWTGPLTTEDLEVDSPYNTRVVKGLPPTPICSPGLDALRAALEPADVDYLYYVLKDTDGNHFFTADYEEFLKAKENAPSQ
jgi:peptidoglycan lytic transglycosylase G